MCVWHQRAGYRYRQAAGVIYLPDGLFIHILAVPHIRGRLLTRSDKFHITLIFLDCLCQFRIFLMFEVFLWCCGNGLKLLADLVMLHSLLEGS